jgi:hypothetical protein
MKQLLTAALLFMVVAGSAQDKMFKNVSTMFLLPGQMEKAKAEIDKLITDPQAQGKAEAWLWKARIYAELYFDEGMSKKYPGSGFIATEAFKKYEGLDASYKMAADAGWRCVDLVYVTGFNAGKKFFEEKKWDSSLTYFESSAYMGEVIVKNNLRKNNAPFDTLTTIYAGYAAQNAKKDDVAAKYYGRLADYKLGGDDYRDIYTYLLIHHANHKNAEAFYKYIAIAKELYPKGDWDDYEVDFMNKAYTLAQKSEMYDKQDAAGTLTARKYLLYGQMFSDLSKEDKEGMDSTKHVYYQKKSIDAFKKAYTKDNSLGLAAFNAGVVLYNQFGDWDDKYRAGLRSLQELNSNRVPEKDPKKKAAADAKFKEQTDAIKKNNTELEKSMLATGDEAIEWLEKAYNTMKEMPSKDKVTKQCLNRTVDYLANIFLVKRDKSRGKDPKAFDAYEAKYKFYDGLHDTFK